MGVSKAALRLALILSLWAVAAAAQSLEPQRTIKLWPAGPPESRSTPVERIVEDRAAAGAAPNRSVTGVSDPTIDVFIAPEPNGQALLIIPGGGYTREVFDKEGYEIAAWFGRRGISSFVLQHRLPAEGWTNRSRVPLQDAQRALRYIRANAKALGLDEHRIGVMGFSAGGHLAGSLATMFDREVYAPRDAIDAISARPDFAVLMYPVVTMNPQFAHMGSQRNLLGNAASAAAIAEWSVEANVHANAPPMILVHAADDSTVPMENSLALQRALVAAKVPVDLHLYAVGGHGFGLTSPASLPVAGWPEVVADWLRKTGSK